MKLQESTQTLAKLGEMAPVSKASNANSDVARKF